jgi:hypothetical protein
MAPPCFARAWRFATRAAARLDRRALTCSEAEMLPVWVGSGKPNFDYFPVFPEAGEL